MVRVWVSLVGFCAATVVLVSFLSNVTAKLEDPNATVLYSEGSFGNGESERRLPVKGGAEYNQLFVEHTNWINSLVFKPLLLKSFTAQLPHFLESWLRNYVAGTIIYFVCGGLWCFWVYGVKGDQYYPEGSIPGAEPIALQMMVSMKGMPLYSALPTVAEYVVEQGWTRCYNHIDEVGWVNWMVGNVLYLMFVEFWIYFMHRGLHDIKPLYKLLHATHHIYNKENTLSPFASLAFNPVDGIIQACPHFFALFVMPTHFFTHEILLFCEAIWTTNIHDCIHGDFFGIMGAGYHTVHHTTYRHNYGHYTIFMDWLLGTLQDPNMKKKQDAKKSS